MLAVRLTASFDDPNVAPSAGRSGTSLELEETDDNGVWAAEAAILTQPGDWSLQARIRQRGRDDSDVVFAIREVGGFLARADEPEGLYDLPFTFVDWNIVAGGAMVVLGVGAFLIWRRRPPSWERETAASVGISSALALIAGAVLLFGVDAHDGGIPRISPVPATNESLAIGKGIFENNCQVCHGLTGEGDGPQAATLEFPPPRLGDHVPFHSQGTIFLWITEGIPVDSEQKNMPAFKELLSDEERWHVVNFLGEAFGSGSFEPVLPEDIASGATPPSAE